jgi:hypothetical protein
LQALLAQAPMETTKSVIPVELALPMPDGRLLRFSVVESPVLEPALQAQYPQIRTYEGKGLDDPSMLTRFDLTPAGFHALVLGADVQAFVEPVDEGEPLRYTSRPHQFSAEARGGCSGEDPAFPAPAPDATLLPQGGVIEREESGASTRWWRRQRGSSRRPTAAPSPRLWPPSPRQSTE